MLFSKRNILVVGASLLLTTAVALATSMRKDRSDPIAVPQDTPITVTLNQSISSDGNRAGDRFVATVSDPVIVDGKTVIPEGSRVQGLVVDAHHSGRLMGRARLSLRLESVEIDGKSYEIRTLSDNEAGGKHNKRNAALIGGGAAGGAVVGAVAAGGTGALIGGPIGAGAGTAAAFFTGKKDIHLHPEEHLTFRLADPVTISTRS